MWAVYLAVWLVTAQLQLQRTIPSGQPQCFQNLCYTVTTVQSVGEFKGKGGGQLIQVSVRMTNRNDEARSTSGLEPYLVDATGAIWPQTTGLGGVPLTLRLPPGATAISQPIFRVQGTPSGLALVLTRHHTGWHWLVIGDPDSPGHKPTLMALQR